MALVSFQYLESPFSRRVGSYPAFIENNAVPSPSKPYFKGSNSIPVGHPSYYIRKCIQEEVKGNEECQGVYPGNLEVSQLHKYEELCNRFVNAGMEKQLHDVESILDCSSKQYIKSTNPFSNSLSVISFESTRFIIPPHCGFFNGDISDFLQQNHPFQYDIIEIDPPWPNKSVKRSKLYKNRYLGFQDIDSLLHRISVSTLCNDNCFILIWITNDPRCIDSVLKFFAHHGITHITTAFWIKVTQSRQPIVPLSCPTRETFERVVVGQYRKQADHQTKKMRIDLSDDKNDLLHHVYQLAGKDSGTHLPDRFHSCDPSCISSIPCIVSSVSFHSRKPNCDEFSFLKLPKNYRGLELFSRKLRERWYSVGNEVFLFQNDSILKSV